MSTAMSEQERIRRQALDKLQEMGIDPYPPEAVEISHLATDVKKKFEESDDEPFEVKLAGRLMNRRIMGKASFAELGDKSGSIQLYFNRDEICPGDDKSMYNDVFKKLIDRGDFLWIHGEVFRTQVGEVSVKVTEFRLLSKSLRPLPFPKTDDEGKVYDAFTDPEARHRQRYVDLVVNPKVKQTFKKRARMINAMRDYLNRHGALEVDTPVLQAIPGGAAAKPFETHHNALDVPMYLRIANELYLKRLIVGGFDWVYEFSRNFRNEGIDRTHNPEFTVLEFYVAYKDYYWMMETTEQMLEEVAKAVTDGATKIEYGGTDIDFKAPYPRVSIYEAIQEHTGFDVSGMNENELREVCKKLKIEIDDSMGKGKLIDEIFGEKCEEKYIQPTFITDHPIEMSPLTKKHREKQGLVERFELVVNGKELANAYTELNDPVDQRERFEEQNRLMERGDEEAMYIDYDFLRALEYGMPPTSGIGFGVDRLAMLFTDEQSIQEVLLFPQMRPEKFEMAPSPADFEKMGVPEEWAPHLLEAGYTPENVKESKPAAIQQKMNGYRKKNKLDLEPLQVEEIEGWLK